MLLFGVLFDVAFTLGRRLMAGERVWEAHRGHLYQVAHRAGMRAEAVTLVHWGFVLWGGACCTVFLGAAGGAKALAPLLVGVPQAAWVAFVVRRARASGVGRW